MAPHPGKPPHRRLALKRTTRRSGGDAAVLATLVVSTLAHGACGSGSNPADASSVTTEPYVLFAPVRSNDTYLMDLQGQLVHRWASDSTPACSVYLLENGELLRPRSLGAGSFPGGGCNGGRVELLDWDGRVVWSYDYLGPDHQQHHDVKRMPNGHVLMIAWETRTRAEALAAGRDPSTIPPQGTIWVDHVVEVDPGTNTIPWVWRAWDHLLPPGQDPAEHPELIDPNAAATPTNDWTHANAVDYNSDRDQVMISVRNFSEFWVIDHSTTTAQASGHTGGRSGRGGDLLYRWGNARNYGVPAPQQIFGQHNAHWIESGLPGEGHVLLFDNGDQNARPYSTVVEVAPAGGGAGTPYGLDPQEGFLPAAPLWRYVATPPESLYARIISSAQRLASGDTLVCDGTGGRFLEITPAGETVWTYLVTDTTGATGVTTFRATRYEAGFLGLSGRTLTPQGPVRAELLPAAAGQGEPPM
ncbi:MAG TPA: aryl-sulfate sulfotransferase [Vicinamibacteria bacterium]|nr:aryl-sulfate sulfotransferase [Vicinamibacteria bacterium]